MKKPILFGDILPQGWLKEEISKDMEGCIGQLDELVPELILEHKIYGKHRLRPDSSLVELGRQEEAHLEIEGTSSQFMWWNSETQSNWRDGHCRNSFLLGEEKHQQKAKAYIDELLATQDEDGYLGIYEPSLRYQHTEENGELWAQASLYRVLLGYYEASKEERVLTAIRRGVDNLMAGYPQGTSNPFDVADSFSGHCHGLTIMDSLFRLTTLTEDETYRNYAIWLYEDYSAHQVSEEDLKISSIETNDYFWKNHGVHTYEHLRAPVMAAYHQPEKYKHLQDMMLSKLPFYLTPSGAPIGDEWIFQRTANATRTGYEYCSIQELLDSYSLLMETTQELSWGDKIEWLYYNAAVGMKHPTESAIMYCKTDNCYEADHRRQPEDVHENRRYLYSPTHQKVAVCCVPNMGRVSAYFVKAMYIKQENGFGIALFGPSTFTGEWENTAVTITQKTDYPATLESKIIVTTSQPVNFTLSIRKPNWAEKVLLDGNEVDSLTLCRTWEGTTELSLAFETKPQFRTDFAEDIFVSNGPLLYALPISGTEETTMKFSLAHFREVAYRPLSRNSEALRIHEDDQEKFILQPRQSADWRNSQLSGRFWDGSKFTTQTMVPMGGTILRKATFQQELREAIE